LMVVRAEKHTARQRSLVLPLSELLLIFDGLNGRSETWGELCHYLRRGFTEGGQERDEVGGSGIATLYEYPAARNRKRPFWFRFEHPDKKRPVFVDDGAALFILRLPAVGNLTL
jgi:hypothetical protein